MLVSRGARYLCQVFGDVAALVVARLQLQGAPLPGGAQRPRVGAEHHLDEGVFPLLHLHVPLHGVSQDLGSTCNEGIRANYVLEEKFTPPPTFMVHTSDVTHYKINKHMTKYPIK